MITINDVIRAIELEAFDVFAAHRRMLPVNRRRIRPDDRVGKPRVGSVLLLLYRHEGKLCLVLTRRPETLNSHAGQISFPGGRQEPGESLAQTALRETFEEVGVPMTEIELLGQLSDTYIPPSDFEVHPFVGVMKGEKRPFFQPNAYEVAEILEVPVNHLLNPNTRKEIMWEFQGEPIDVPYFDVDGHKVWGATAIMLNEFIERLRAAHPHLNHH